MTTSPAQRGFADPVRDAQSVFRTVMMALARPGTIGDLAAGPVTPPAPLTPELAAVALTLCDHETPVWFDRELSADPDVAAFIQVPDRRADRRRSGQGRLCLRRRHGRPAAAVGLRARHATTIPTGRRR